MGLQQTGSIVPLRKVQALVAEFIGTFFLVLTVVLSGARSKNPLAGVHAPTAIGLTLASMIYAFNHVSGAQFNPAVTLATVLTRRMKISTALLYVAAQCLGGIAGALTGFAIAGAENIEAFAPASVSKAFAVEALYAFAIILVQQNAAAEKNAREPNSYFGLAVAFTVLAGAGVSGPISGGCFNPAVGMALDFVSLLVGSSGISYMWLYWTAPLLGAALAALLKTYMNLPSHQESTWLPVVVPLTEFIGTFFLVLTASCSTDGLAIGAMMLAMIYMGDHVCGADYNPAISLGVALRMGVPLREYPKVFVTILAQFAGAFLAAVTAQELQGSVNYPNNTGINNGFGEAFAYEALWTSLLVYSVCAVMTPTQSEEEQELGEERKGHSRSYQGLAIGFLLAGGIYAADENGSASGGVFNPALGTGIAVIDWAYNGANINFLWIYWAGPFIGSFLGAGIFVLLHSHKDPTMYDLEEEMLVN
jgi:aquaporin Z